MDINPDCAALGWMYHDQSSGVEKDPAQAVAWYRKAAEQGYAPGQTNLGWMYEQGSGIKKDLKQAIDWYRKAAAGGEEYAKQNLTRLGVLVEGWSCATIATLTLAFQPFPQPDGICNPVRNVF